MKPEPPVRGLADTARWVALYRADETERPDAHFHDPWARDLAGARGSEVYAALPRPVRKIGWSFVARTVLFDRLVLEEVAAGATTVLNLAAGLDTRPYRLALPSTLRWIEVDQAGLLEEKASVLAGVEPRCRLERVALDLTDVSARQALFRKHAGPGQRVLVMTEGLLIYLTEPQVASLAEDLRQPGFAAWATELVSPRLFQIMQRGVGRQLETGGAGFRFAPQAGPAFFPPLGWEPAAVHPIMPAAARLKRLPLLLRLFASLPGAGTFHPRRPWSAVCLLRPIARTAS